MKPFYHLQLLGGPMDYTPGIFEIKMSYYDKQNRTSSYYLKTIGNNVFTVTDGS
jgi:hypothetical protein